MKETHTHAPHEGCAGCNHPPSGESRVLNPDAGAGCQTTLRVVGMCCADEVEAVQRALKPIPGVREVRVNLVGGSVAILHGAEVGTGTLIRAIASAGLKASAPGAARVDPSFVSAYRAQLISVVLSGVLTGLGLVAEWTQRSSVFPAIALFIAAIISGGWFILPKTIGALRRISLDMNVLMTIAVFGAMAIGQWSEGAAVVFLFALSELLEAFSLGRARRAIQSLMQLSPSMALLKQTGGFKETPVEQIEVGDTIAIKSGMRIPLDGEVISGRSAINQAPITGESLPVEKEIGDFVFAGTINGDGSLEVRVTRPHNETTLARIIHMVEEAQAGKAPTQRFVDRFAKYYTPAVMALALLVWIALPILVNGEWLVWTYRALVLLVIACPCALVISTPVSIVSGLTALARRGVLVKGGAALEAIGRLTALAMDKTGTITEGKPRVTGVTLVSKMSEPELLRIAAAIDVHSDHPLAQAVVEHVRGQGIEFPRSESYRAQNGRGAEGEIGGHTYFVGNHRFTHELLVCSPELESRLAEIESKAQSVVVVGHKPHVDCAGEVIGIIAVADHIRPNAAGSIRGLHSAGVETIVMLSGDNQRTVDAIAEQAGIDEAYGDLLPEDKVQRIRDLMMRHKHVGMIGDGVNDAPAMATASVGIAMGGAGTDTALETADMALMQDDLSQLAEAVCLGRRTLRIIQANIGFALGLKGAFLLLAISGHTSLWFAILADTGATLAVIANALRLLRSGSQ